MLLMFHKHRYMTYESKYRPRQGVLKRVSYHYHNHIYNDTYFTQYWHGHTGATSLYNTSPLVEVECNQCYHYRSNGANEATNRGRGRI